VFDGLRAISVLGVIGVHSGLHIAHAGGFGVQVFFVLSGFLITTLLVREFERTKAIDLAAFYIRRGLRLLPALAVFLAVCAVVSLPASAPYRSQTYSAIPYAIAYSYNWVQALANPPFGLVTHTWSLAIEEQFYIAWPLVMLFVIRAGGRSRALLAVAVTAAVLSAVWAHILWIETQSAARIYYGSDTGGAPLMLGSAAGLLRLCVNWTPTRLQVLRVIGGIGLAVTAVGFLKAWPSPIEYSGVGFGLEVGVACGVLGLVAAPIRPAEWLLSLSPLVVLGRISYGAYLWQGVVLMLLAAYLRLAPLELLLVGTPLTIIVSLLSYRFVERPFLMLKNSFSTKRQPNLVAQPVGAPNL
jgi:peptidoglycan/LPS O-acetylase OafA/YrhL